jgi:hypothetical protein
VEGGRVAGEAVQVLEAAPVLDHRRAAVEQAQLGAEQPLLGMAPELAEHPRHGRVDRPPVMDLPGPVEPHADEEHHEVALELSRVPARVDRCHAGRLLLVDVRAGCGADARKP